MAPMTSIYQLVRDGDVVCSASNSRAGLDSLYALANMCMNGNAPRDTPLRDAPEFQLEVHLWDGSSVVEVAMQWVVLNTP
jgi:hypothetical protein